MVDFTKGIPGEFSNALQRTSEDKRDSQQGGPKPNAHMEATKSAEVKLGVRRFSVLAASH